jgi:LCP family protein required for cell wall assembly
MTQGKSAPVRTTRPGPRSSRISSRSVPPVVAMALSFIFPGLGQVAVGQPRRGAIVAMPAIAVTLTLVIIALFDRSALYQILSPRFLASVLILDLVGLVYHVWAMADGYMLAAKLRPRTPGANRSVGLGAVAVLVVGALTVHGGVASLDLQAQTVLGCSFNADGPCIPDIQPGQSVPSFDYVPDDTPDPTTSDSGSSAGPTDTVGPTDTGNAGPLDTTAYPVPPACTGAANTWADSKCTMYLLLIGGDAGVGRGGYAAGKPINLRTDTMILLQVDLSTGRSAMYGIPRNLMNVPLGTKDWNAYSYHFFPALKAYGAAIGGCGTNANPCLFNALWYDAAFAHPSRYPYPGNYFARASKAVEDSVSALMGVPVNGAIVVDLPGFVDLINALAPSGLKINVPYEVRQSPGTPYTDSDNRRIYNLDFKTGVQTLNGEQALAYARLRHVVAHDSDIYRMARQQLVLNALLDQVSPCSAALNISSLLTAVKGTLWTDLSWDDAPALAALATKIKPKNVRTITLTPSKGYAANVVPNIGDRSVLNVYQAAPKKGLSGVPSAYTNGSQGGGGGGGGGGFHC